MSHRNRMMLLFALLGVAGCVMPLCRTAYAISDVCEDECSPIPDRGLFSCRRRCVNSPDKQGTERKQLLPTGFFFLNEKIQTRLVAPVLQNAEASPNPAMPGQPLRVTVRMSEDEKQDPPFVAVFYTFDDANAWHAAQAEYDKAGGDFATFLPVPGDIHRIRWFLRAVSEDNNAYTEIPCTVERFPFESGDCLVPLSSETTYADYEKFTADPAMDIVKSRAGYSTDSLYFEVETAAPIVNDKKKPFTMNAYYIGVYNPAEWTGLEPMANVVFLFYTPWAYADDHCIMYKRMGREWERDTSGISCAVDGARLMIRARRDMLPADANGAYSAFIATSFNSFPTHSQGQTGDDETAIIVDYTGASSVMPVTREIPVSEQSVDLE